MSDSTAIITTISTLLRQHPECIGSVLNELVAIVGELEAANKPNVKPEPKKATRKQGKHAKKVVEVEHEWYDEFNSEFTTVKVLDSTVQVTVARGHADEWHDKLRAAGFTWGKKLHGWWAYLDDEKRVKVAERNQRNDAATAGMTRDEKREYWRARKAARTA